MPNIKSLSNCKTQNIRKKVGYQEGRKEMARNLYEDFNKKKKTLNIYDLSYTINGENV